MAATKKATAKKTSTTRTSAAKKATTTTARKKPSTKKATATRRQAAPKRTPLLERERQTIAEDASYAVAGLAVGTVTLGKAAIAKIEELRGEVAKAAKDPKSTVRTVGDEAPAAVRSTVDGVRSKLIVELEAAIASFEKTFDARATEGRRIVADLKKDARINRFLDQTSSTRTQLKGAFTSVAKTAEVAVDAGRKQADNATGQVKGAATSATKGADNASTQLKGAVTSLAKVAEAAVGAGRKQAETARTQVKAATTSVKKTVDAAPDAAEATVAEVDDAS
jgi:hypothetical protein